MKMPKRKPLRKNPKLRLASQRRSKPGSKFQKTQRIIESIQTNIKKNSDKKNEKPLRPGKTPRKPLGKKPKKIILPSTLALGLERLEKHMAQAGMASRREAKDLITRGLVTVNGKTIREPGFGIKKTDNVAITAGSLHTKEVILFYKPRGIETTKTSPDSVDIHDKFPQFAHLAPVGRLDKDSEGLILLSNDGVLTKMITGEQSTVDKEYLVKTREDVMPAMLERMERGIKLDGEMTKPCVAHKISKNEYTITLHEGRKHQVRRMANACKLTIKQLIRIRIGNLKIGKMTAGNFKKLPDAVVQELKKQ